MSRRTRLSLAALVLLALSIAALVPAGANVFRAEPGGPAKAIGGPVELKGFVRVVDGQTIDAWVNGQRVGITLSGVTAPGGNTQCGAEAAGLLRRLLRDGVVLEEDPPTFDQRGRRVFRGLTRAERKPVATEMIRAGAARASGQGKHVAENRRAEDEARAAGRGCVHGGRSAQEAAAAAPAVQPRSATGVPEGLVDEVLGGGLNQPTAMALLPDGRTLVAEKGGLVRLFKNGSFAPAPFLDIRDRVNDYYDRGLLGLAADPDFALNGHLYLLYVYENDPTEWGGPKTARLTRVTAAGDSASPDTEVVLVGRAVGRSCNELPAGADCIPSDADSHSVGAIRFAADKTIFFSVGDAASFNLVNDDALRAQNVDSFAGKILHVTRTGQGVPGNPFWNGDPNANRSKVWALGVRNAFRFGLRPGSGTPFVGDVGWGEFEEVNVASPGANLGWPCYEGEGRQGGYESRPACQSLYAQGTAAWKRPLHSYAHVGGGAAVTGGAFYDGAAFPEVYRGAYFFGDYAQGWIKYLKVDAADRLVGEPTTFATNADGPVAIDVGADGALYYLAINKGELRRIRAGARPPPTTCTLGAVGTFQADYFTNRTLAGTPALTRCEFAIDHSWSSGGPAAGIGPDNFSSRWRGRFTFAAGTYTFVASADDGIRLSVDGARIIDAWKDQPVTTYRAERALTAGEHEIVVEYYENGGGALARVSWQSAQPTACPPGQFRGEYFANPHLTGDPSFVRCDPAISEDWGYLGPGGGLGSDNFSVRWTGRPTFATDTYTFTAVYDDGMRVYLDGAPLLDRWDGSTAQAQLARGLTAGEHELKVEYYEGGGSARASLVWVPSNPNRPPVPRIDGPSAALRPAVGEAITFSGSAADPEDGAVPAGQLTWHVTIHHCPGGACHSHPFMTTTGTGGTFVMPDHGDDSRIEIALTAVDRQGVPATTSVTLDPRTVTLTLTSSPPGLRLVYVGTTVTTPYTREVQAGAMRTVSAPSPQGGSTFVSWSDGGAQQHDVTLTGPTALTATYAGGAASCAKGQFYAEYFPDRALSGAPAFARCEGAIDYHWSDAGPGGGLGASNYSVRWTGRFDFPAGEHSFTAAADDGVRLFLDDDRLVDAWVEQPVTAFEARRTLAAGEHRLRMEYFQGYGGAEARLRWQATVPAATCASGQFRAEYFPNRALTGSPLLARCETTIDHRWDSGGPGGGLPNDNFSARWVGRFALPAGMYTFTATADDGVRLYVDDVLLIDGWRDQPTTTYQARQQLAVGEHVLRLEYYEHGGGATARLQWRADAPAASCPTGQYLAEYFDGVSLAGAPVLTRCEAAIDYGWGSAGPGSWLDGTTYSVRWTGRFPFAAGVHTFTAVADDGVRVYVGGRTAIDAWRDQGATAYRADLTLSAGEHEVKMEYYQAYGGSEARLSWQP